MFLSDIQNNYNFLKEWVLTPAPYFFPDLLIYFLIDRGDIGHSILFYVFIFTLTLFYLASIMILKSEKYFSQIDVIFIFMILNVVLLSYNKLYFFYSPTYHSTIYLFGVFLIINKDNINRKITLLIYILSFLFGLSDPFVIIQIIIPSIFYCLISRYPDKNLLNWNLMYFIRVLLFSILGKLFINGLHKNKLIIVPEVPIFKSFFYILKNLLFIENLSKSFHYFLQEFYEVKILYIFILLFILIFIFDKKYTKIEIIYTYIFATMLLFIFQGWFGIWIGYRYMWFFYIYPVAYIVYYILLKINIYFQISVREEIKTISYIQKIKWIFPIFVLLFQFYYFQENIETILNFYQRDYRNIEINTSSHLTINYPVQKILPPDINCINELSKKYYLSRGVSDYWNAKYITFFSNNKFLVNQYTSNMEEYYWINNKSLFKIRNELVYYNFIITDRLNIDKIIELIGNPDFIEICGENHIYIYKKYFQVSSRSR